MPRRREPADQLEAAAVARALADETPGRFERRVLEQLIYERVRQSVDVCELMSLQLDLSASVENALSACARSPGERSDLTMDYLQRAWERLSDEVLGRFFEGELGGCKERVAEADPPPS